MSATSASAIARCNVATRSLEEAPSPALDAELRTAIGAAARRGVRAADYTNAGTVEFLVEDGEFYFMEVNTRIQVEHTVTEEVTGLDVVRGNSASLQARTGLSQDDVSIDGHAVEYRINAENPAEDFAPTPGPLTTYAPPAVSVSGSTTRSPRATTSAATTTR